MSQPSGLPAPALAVQDLRVRYGGFEAVHGVSLEVPVGGLVALLGPNGAGKTSTILAILGLQAMEGEVRLFGQPVAHLPSWRRAQQGVSWVPEGRRVLGQLTVEENLQMGAYRFLDRWARLSRQSRQRLEEVFELFPVLAQRRRQLAGTLSGGEQQMLAIGRALMSDPRVLLVDEATTGLMPRAAEEVLGVLGDVKRLGISVLLVEQNVHGALAIADHAYVMASGQVVLAGEARSLLDSPIVASAYLGQLRRSAAAEAAR